MKITTSKEFLGEIKKYQYLNDLSNEDIAQRRGVSRQTVSSFFIKQNPRLDNVLETIDAMDAELHIEIRKKEKDEK